MNDLKTLIKEKAKEALESFDFLLFAVGKKEVQVIIEQAITYALFEIAKATYEDAAKAIKGRSPNDCCTTTRKMSAIIIEGRAGELKAGKE